MIRRRLLGLLALAAVAGCSSALHNGAASRTESVLPPTSSAASGVPRFDHVLVVVEENHGFTQVVGSPQAPYLSQLVQAGVLFTESYAVAHPSEPNYLALFSGSTHGLDSDACPLTYRGPDLYSALHAVGRTFVGYAEGLDHPGSAACSSGSYARKHAPWADFSDVPSSARQPFTAFPADFATLPSVAFVIPNLDHDMHDGSIAEADTWLRTHLGDYATWATTHNSLLILTFDEDDTAERNRIATVVAGAQVRPGIRSAQRIDHYAVLRTIEDAFGAEALGLSADRQPITGIWR